MYAWRKRTSARRLQYFDIKFTNYEVDIADVKEAVSCEMELVSYLIYKVQITFQQGLNSEKQPQTKRMIWQKSCMTLIMLFVCLYVCFGAH